METVLKLNNPLSSDIMLDVTSDPALFILPVYSLGNRDSHRGGGEVRQFIIPL